MRTYLLDKHSPDKKQKQSNFVDRAQICLPGASFSHTLRLVKFAIMVSELCCLILNFARCV